jgi:hypothetical protein
LEGAVIDRTVETILARWRQLERELEDTADGDRALIEARITAVREELRVAIEARWAEARALLESERADAR